VIVYINHKNLKKFMTARVLNCRQARWNMLLFWFNFVITYWLEKQQMLFDALSRRSYLVPKEGKAAYEQQRTTLLKVEQLSLRIATMSTPVDSLFFNEVRAASTMDPLVLDIKRCSDNNCEKFKFVDNLLYFEEQLYILKRSTRLQDLQAYHDFPAAGHFGFNKMLEFIS
jgi:hypothetical protein